MRHPQTAVEPQPVSDIGKVDVGVAPLGLMVAAVVAGIFPGTLGAIWWFIAASLALGVFVALVLKWKARDRD